MGTLRLSVARYRPAMHLLLVLALFAPLMVWSPALASPDAPSGAPVETEAADTASASYLTPVFRARISHRTLTIEGVGFSKSHTLQVGATKRKPVYWVLIGSTQATRYGKVKATFNLPSSMWGERLLWVCLRDVTTGKITCAPAYRY